MNVLRSGEVYAALPSTPKTMYFLDKNVQVKTSFLIRAQNCHLPKPRTSFPKEDYEWKVEMQLQIQSREKNIGFRQKMKLGFNVQNRKAANYIRKN